MVHRICRLINFSKLSAKKDNISVLWKTAKRIMIHLRDHLYYIPKMKTQCPKSSLFAHNSKKKIKWTWFPVLFSLSAPARSMIVKTALFDLGLTAPLHFGGASRMLIMHCDRLQVQKKRKIKTLRWNYWLHNLKATNNLWFV